MRLWNEKGKGREITKQGCKEVEKNHARLQGEVEEKRPGSVEASYLARGGVC